MSQSFEKRPYLLALAMIGACVALGAVNGLIDVGAALHDAVCAEHRAERT